MIGRNIRQSCLYFLLFSNDTFMTMSVLDHDTRTSAFGMACAARRTLAQTPARSAGSDIATPPERRVAMIADGGPTTGGNMTAVKAPVCTTPVSRFVLYGRRSGAPENCGVCPCVTWRPKSMSRARKSPRIVIRTPSGWSSSVRDGSRPAWTKYRSPSVQSVGRAATQSTMSRGKAVAFETPY